MNFKVEYKVKNKMNAPSLSDVSLDGMIGARFDRFAYERVSSDFAIKEILREAELCFRDQYDDEYNHGLWRSEFWGKLMISACRVCRMKVCPPTSRLRNYAPKPTGLCWHRCAADHPA